MAAHRLAVVLNETRATLAEARAALAGQSASDGDGLSGGPAGILGLYDALRARLDTIDEKAVHGLLSRIAAHVQRLTELRAEIERIERLRSALTGL